MLIEQGDLCWLDFDPSAGHEPRKRRPALVISTGEFNNVYSSLTFVCPITSTVSTHPFHIPMPADMSVQGMICVEQAAALNPAARHLEPTGEYLDKQTMGIVLEVFASFFGL